MRIKHPILRDGVALWQCSKCKQWLKEEDYYEDHGAVNGLKSHCKKCHSSVTILTRDRANARRLNKEYARRKRKNNPVEMRERDRLAARKRKKTEKTIARDTLNAAVRCGKIVKPILCSGCGKTKKLTGHHNDYSKPLDVEWLCYECHGMKTVETRQSCPRGSGDTD